MNKKPKSKPSAAEQMGREDLDQHALIERYSYFVRAVVKRMIGSMSLPRVHRDEYEAAGYLGLVEAAARYDRNSGVDFTNFAYLRIRGAIIDNIRSHSHVSGRAYHSAKALQAMNSLRELELPKQERKTSRQEAITELLDYAAKGALAFRLGMCEVESSTADARAEDPEARLNFIQERKLLRKLVATLPKKERLIIEHFYFEEKSFTDISNVGTKLSKSWISRLHARGIDLLKKRYLDLRAKEEQVC